MGHVKTSITIPEDLLDKARELSDNFSSVVADALRHYIRMKRVEKAAGSFGGWEERESGSADIVDKLRKEERGYADRSD